ncbi:MAG: hypothetical protein ACE5FM_10690 [Methyloligellaceae bacterium]
MTKLASQQQGLMPDSIPTELQERSSTMFLPDDRRVTPHAKRRQHTHDPKRFLSHRDRRTGLSGHRSSAMSSRWTANRRHSVFLQHPENTEVIAFSWFGDMTSRRNSPLN